MSPTMTDEVRRMEKELDSKQYKELKKWAKEIRKRSKKWKRASTSS